MGQGNTLIPWWRIQYTEQDAEAVSNAVRNEHISLGPLTALFEEQLALKLSVPYVVATTSGTMALLMALIAAGVGYDDEVIIPNRTWIAAAHAVMMVGAKVVLVDVLPDVPCIDVAKIEEKITSRTRAIIPTALNGRKIHLNQIKSLADQYHLTIIEDAAQAFFSQEEGQFIGTQSALGCFSLSVAKIIPTGQGGFIATKEKHFYDELRKIRTHGVDNLLNCDYTRFGLNFSYTDLQASIGITQLQKVEQKIASLRKIYHCYEEGLKHAARVRLIPVDLSTGELPLYVEVLCQDRDRLIRFLGERKIQTKAFYPNLNRAPYLRSDEIFPHADLFEAEGLTLPSGPDQSLDNIAEVVQAIHSYENQARRSYVNGRHCRSVMEL